MDFAAINVVMIMIICLFTSQYCDSIHFLFSCDGRELEAALVACRESIQKRFPDSVANLLYSNVVGSLPGAGSHGSAPDFSGGKQQSDALAQALGDKERYRVQVETATREGEQRLRSLRQVRASHIACLLSSFLGIEY